MVFCFCISHFIDENEYLMLQLVTICMSLSVNSEFTSVCHVSFWDTDLFLTSWWEFFIYEANCDICCQCFCIYMYYECFLLAYDLLFSFWCLSLTSSFQFWLWLIYQYISFMAVVSVIYLRNFHLFQSHKDVFLSLLLGSSLGSQLK